MEAESGVHLQRGGQSRGEGAEGDLGRGLGLVLGGGGQAARVFPHGESLIGGGGGRVQQGRRPLP